MTIYASTYGWAEPPVHPEPVRPDVAGFAVPSPARQNGRVTLLTRWTGDARYRIRPRRRRASVAIVSATAALAFIGVMTLPSPYVIDVPGPVFNTLGETTVTDSSGDQSTVPVIKVDGATTYPTSGDLNMLTVSQWGSPSALPSAFEVLQGWISGTSRVIPIDQAYPPGTTTESEATANAESMASSQQTAVAAALTHLGYKGSPELVVESISEGSHAQGVLVAGDVVTEVNGTAVSTVDQILALAAKASDADPLKVTFTRDGTKHTESIAPMTGEDGVKRLGVAVTISYSFPVSVTVNLENVGGPSAGMMFALGIIDTLTPGELTGGRSIAGTGTIDAEGKVGAIGGIQQKMVSAVRAGSTLFLAPSDNCDAVVGHIPAGLSVVKVSTLDEALTAVTQYASTGSANGLPVCGS